MVAPVRVGVVVPGFVPALVPVVPVLVPALVLAVPALVQDHAISHVLVLVLAVVCIISENKRVNCNYRSVKNFIFNTP